MIILLAIIGALALGLLAGLTYKGFVMFGDRHQLGMLTEHLTTEHRMSMATNQAIARMRAVARDHLRSDNRSA